MRPTIGTSKAGSARVSPAHPRRGQTEGKFCASPFCLLPTSFWGGRGDAFCAPEPSYHLSAARRPGSRAYSFERKTRGPALCWMCSSSAAPARHRGQSCRINGSTTNANTMLGVQRLLMTKSERQPIRMDAANVERRDNESAVRCCTRSQPCANSEHSAEFVCAVATYCFASLVGGWATEWATKRERGSDEPLLQGEPLPCCRLTHQPICSLLTGTPSVLINDIGHAPSSGHGPRRLWRQVSNLRFAARMEPYVTRPPLPANALLRLSKERRAVSKGRYPVDDTWGKDKKRTDTSRDRTAPSH